jgi:hypothetical protein
MRENKLISEWLRLHRLKRIVWNECVWWGEPIRVPKKSWTKELEADSILDGRGGGPAVLQSDREGQA